MTLQVPCGPGEIYVLDSKEAGTRVRGLQGGEGRWKDKQGRNLPLAERPGQRHGTRSSWWAPRGVACSFHVSGSFFPHI